MARAPFTSSGTARLHIIDFHVMSMIGIAYAGACKKITHLKIFRLDYPKGKKPTITYIDPDKLKDEVKSFKFAPA